MSEEGHSGGYDLEFLDDNISQDYECPICMVILKNPQMVSCCGRKFCKSCIDRIVDANKPCPYCKEEFTCMAEKQLNRRILDLNIKCARAKVGCDWIGELRQLDSHLQNACLYAEVVCRLGCGEIMLREILEHHEMDNCVKRPPESKLLRLTQKLECRLESVEKICEEQNGKIAHLEEEVHRLTECNEAKSLEIASLTQSLHSMKDNHQDDMTQSLKAIEGELIRRCFCLSFSLCLDESDWVGPPFFSHQNGYLLQLSASMPKHQSVLSRFVRSVILTGARPDRYPITLSVDILPRQQDEASLDWPIHISVDVLILTNSDSDANAKLVTVSCYKGLPPSQEDLPDRSPDYDEDDYDDECVIAHVSHSFTCSLVILKINRSLEPPKPHTSK